MRYFFIAVHHFYSTQKEHQSIMNMQLLYKKKYLYKTAKLWKKYAAPKSQS